MANEYYCDSLFRIEDTVSHSLTQSLSCSLPLSLAIILVLLFSFLLLTALCHSSSFLYLCSHLLSIFPFLSLSLVTIHLAPFLLFCVSIFPPSLPPSLRHGCSRRSRCPPHPSLHVLFAGLKTRGSCRPRRCVRRRRGKPPLRGYPHKKKKKPCVENTRITAPAFQGEKYPPHAKPK